MQTRVDDDVYEFLTARADTRDASMSEYLRELLTDVTDARIGSDGTIKQRFLCDISNIGDPDGDLATALDRDWETFRDSEGRQVLQELLLNGNGETYLVGQGSSLAAANWMAARLRDRGIHATAHTAQQVPEELVGEDDTIICLSRSGETISVHELCEEVDGTVAVLTAEGSKLYSRNDIDICVPIPTLEEHLDHYSKQNFVSQILVLQELLSERPATATTIQARLEVVESFISDHVSRDNDHVSLQSDSPFYRAAAKLNHEDDLDLDLIATGFGRYTAHCSEFIQKYPELLYENATYEDPGSVRDRLLNLLYTEQALLCSIVPRNESETGEEAYEQLTNYVFRSRNSVDDLLKFNPEPRPLRLLALTFNDPDEMFEQGCTNQSLYDDRSVIPLPHHDDEFANDIILYVAIYLLIYAILDRKWEQYPKVRQAIIRRVFTSNEDRI